MNRISRQKQIVISAALIDKMLSEVELKDPEEACGLLAGVFEVAGSQALEVLPVENILHSPVRYRMRPEKQLEALEWMDARALDLIGIYHSHPAGPPYPSPTDIAEAFYPETAYIIIFRQDGQWDLKGFAIQEGEVTLIEILVI